MSSRLSKDLRSKHDVSGISVIGSLRLCRWSRESSSRSGILGFGTNSRRHCASERACQCAWDGRTLLSRTETRWPEEITVLVLVLVLTLQAKSIPVRKDDEVLIVRGKYKGQEGKVTQVSSNIPACTCDCGQAQHAHFPF